MNQNKSKYFHLFIINKHGGLMYTKNFVESGISSDAMLIAAASFHSMDALSTLLTPPSVLEREGKSENKTPFKPKLESVVTDTFRLHCYETMTGMKFVLCADLSLSQQEARAFLKQLYEAFSDYVLKDPFFVPEQLIKNKNFEKSLQTLLENY